MKRAVACVGFALLVGGGFVTAQETTGEIIGTVTSEDGLPLPGVTVAVEDAERGFARSAVTGSEGSYRLVALPPADYRLTARLDGFQTYQRTVRVDLGRTVTSNLEMALGAFSDVIEVSGEAPLVDVRSTVTGINVSADDLHGRLPIQREVTEVAFLAPSTVAGDSAFEESAARTGDGTTPGQRPVSIAGGSVAENGYQVNGLNITNFRKLIGSTMVPYEFLQEVQVKTGGYEAEFGRSTGGVINMVTKSGTNSLRGGLSAYLEPESLQGQEPDTYERANEMEDRELVEANASLGGPIVRDRLFFFGFVRYSDGSSTHYRLGRGEWWSLDEPYWGGKLDWNITASHRLEGTLLSDAVEKQITVVDFDFDDRAVVGVVGVGRENRGGENYIVKYTGLLGDSVLLAAQYGANDFDRTDSSENDDCPAAADVRTGETMPVGCWVNWFRGTSSDGRRAYRLDVDWFVARHSVRAGVDSEDNTSELLTDFSGGVFYTYDVNSDDDGDGLGDRFPDHPAGEDIVRVRHYGVGGSFPVESQAAYLQDSWAATPALTLNLGLRYERYTNRDGLGQDFIEVNDQWAPRLGVVWDPGGSGRQKLFASIGRYHLPVASNVNVRMGGATYWSEAWYGFDGEPDATDGSPPGYTDCGFGNVCPNQGTVGDLLSTVMIADGVVNDPRASVADDFDPISEDELIVGYERLLGQHWSVGVRGILRRFNEVIEDFGIDKTLWEVYGVECLAPDLIGTPGHCGFVYRMGNPGQDFAGWFDLDGNGELDPITLSSEELNYPQPEREYNAVELGFRRRFADRWMLQGSYTWSQLNGNFEGYVNSEVGQSDAGLNQTYDYQGLLDHGSGDMPQDRRHNVKLFGSYIWGNGLQLGGNFWFHTGRPVNSLSVHPTDPWSALYGAFSFFLPDGTPAPRGSQGRTDNLWSLDLMAKYDFSIGAADLFARIDVFNLFDNSGVREVDEFAEHDSGAANEHWKEPTHYQRPRTVRLGIGVSF